MTGGTQFKYISSGELKIARKTAPIFTKQGSSNNGPYTNFAGPIEVSGKFTGVIATTSDPWSTGTSASALTQSNQAIVISLVDPNDTAVVNSFSFQMSQCQFQNVKRTRGKEYVEVEVEFTANANSNDLGAGSGFSPLLVTVQNAINTAG